ncbi:MAG: orotate phosphoribosyltransferase [Bacteroidia bacterium]|nr:orotate phosphoribosyltransferase [Bacteroidia bacterium]
MPVESHKIAEYLLKIKAVKFNLDDPFKWSSGWQSPIYCDNRLTLSYPEVRTYIRDAFVEKVRKKYPETEGIAGVATGAIAQGALVAQELGFPMLYVRSKAKGHGMQNLIEGDREVATKYVVIEDLISTGRSSVHAVQALQDEGLEILGTLSIFSYGFPHSNQAFISTGTSFSPLTTLQEVMEVAKKIGYLKESDFEAIRAWQQDPESWNRSF